MEIEMAVVGAGPAGLSAAIEAAEHGVQVTVIDENSSPGGQLFKQIHRFFGSKANFAGMRGYDIGNYLLKRAEKLGVEVKLGTVAWGAFKEKELGLFNRRKVESLKAKSLVVATGALEKPLAFPGWTLPGVMGAGAVQTMINIHRVLPGKKVLMVGAGNVGLIVSYQLIQAGADVVAVIEAKPKIGGWLVHASKIARMGVPILTSHTILKAEGKEEVEKAIIAALENFKVIPETKKVLEVDLICLAVGLSPEVDLCRMLGCKLTYIPILGGYVPLHSSEMETTIPGVYVAGDASGIEEATTAMEEGRLTGLVIAEKLGYLSPEEALDKKLEVKERLQELRTGPFGSPIKRAKDTVFREFEMMKSGN